MFFFCMMINCEYTLCNILCTARTFFFQIFICHNKVFISEMIIIVMRVNNTLTSNFMGLLILWTLVFI